MTYLRKLDTHDDLDTIILHLQGRLGAYELSPKMEEIIKNMDVCRDLIRQYGSRGKVVPMLETTLGIKKSTAEKLYVDTLHVFNTSQASHRDFWIDTAMGLFMETRRKALAKSDMKSVTAAETNIARLIALMTDSKDAEIYARINVQRRIITFDPSLTGVTLPDDYEAAVESLIKKAKSRDLSSIPDAEEVKPNDGAS